ncbi:MAG: nodulation protein NfeD [Ignavibacteriaceae bacterium]|nr:nodulation protein NfeD [Ignavibacteriaceae bacterium]
MMIRFTSLIFLILLSFPLFGQTKNVTVITLDGEINPAASDYIHYGIEQAKENNSECLILRLNTPGGLLESTRIIVSSILESPVPVVVYVSPPGARAASAGVFITLSAHIAAMAPGTNIGAAHPVSIQGQMDSTMTEKVTNDAAAFIRSISQKRNRNIQWAEEAVRKSLSITETEALNQNVIDLISPGLRSLLDTLNSKQVQTIKGTVVLQTKDAKINYLDMSFQQKLLSILSDPNIAYILFMLGIYGLLFELYNPGLIFPGIIGVISLVLAFYTMSTLPINYAGLILIIFAVVLFILEIKIVSHGLLTAGGILSLIMGSIMLINNESPLNAVSISWEVIALVTVLTLLFFFFAISLGIKAQRRKPVTGPQGLVNEIGEAITEIDRNGLVKLHGEIWKAESQEGYISRGSKIIVTGISNLRLLIKKSDK